MESQRVLVIDDDFDARLLISRLLEAGGYATAGASDAEEALAMLRVERFGLVLMDVLLPDLDGFECCRRIREVGELPVMMVSSLADTKSVVRGLDAGADDYVVKPFDRAELLARVRAVLRRGSRLQSIEPPASLPAMEIGPLHLDFSAQAATIGTIDLNLTGKELLLLYTLAEHTGMLLSRGHIFKAVWGDDVYDDSKTLDVHISRLRKKLDAAGGFGSLLKTVRNRGYMLSSAMKEAVVPSQKGNKAKS